MIEMIRLITLSLRSLATLYLCFVTISRLLVHLDFSDGSIHASNWRPKKGNAPIVFC